MFGRFFYGQCSLAEAFWKFSFLGLAVSGFVSRLLMIIPEAVGRIRNPLSAGSMEQHFPSEHESGCFYLAVLLYRSILAVLTYSVVCIVGMWNTYKEYEKSKVLAFICMLLVWVMVYFAVKFSIY